MRVVKVTFCNKFTSGAYSCFEPCFYLEGNLEDEVAFFGYVRRKIARILRELGLVDLARECSLGLEVSDNPFPKGDYKLSIEMPFYNRYGEENIYICDIPGVLSKELAFCTDGLEDAFGCVPKTIYVVVKEDAKVDSGEVAKTDVTETERRDDYIGLTTFKN